MSKEEAARSISWVCGWAYFILWSAAVYPQPILNYKRRSTEGLTFDFPLLNLLGAVCFTASCALLLYSSTVRAAYAARYPASPEPTVRFNDLCVGTNAVVLDAIVVSQFWPSLWGWNPIIPPNRHPGKVTLGVAWGSALAVTLCVATMLASPASMEWELLDVVYALVYVKLWTAVFKYTPQAVSNLKRKSTLGWSIHYVHLDVGGGIFSLAQLLIDASLQPDWSGLAGNPLKLWLAAISLTADVVFLVQHYVLYGAVEPQEPGGRSSEQAAEEHAPEGEESIMLAELGAAAESERGDDEAKEVR